MDRAVLESLSREQLIEIILAQAEMIAQLTKRIEESRSQAGPAAEDTGQFECVAFAEPQGVEWDARAQAQASKKGSCAAAIVVLIRIQPRHLR